MVQLFSVFIGKLPLTATKLELEKVFSQFGEVKNSFIASEPGNRGFTYGFVRYTNKADAMEAVLSSDSITISGNAVRVEFSTDLSDSAKLNQEAFRTRQKHAEVAAVKQRQQVSEAEEKSVLRLLNFKMVLLEANQRAPENERIDVNSLLVELSKMNPRLLQETVDRPPERESFVEIIQKEHDEQEESGVIKRLDSPIGTPSNNEQPVKTLQHASSAGNLLTEKSPTDINSIKPQRSMPNLKSMSSGVCGTPTEPTKEAPPSRVGGVVKPVHSPLGECGKVAFSERHSPGHPVSSSSNSPLCPAETPNSYSPPHEENLQRIPAMSSDSQSGPRPPGHHASQQSMLHQQPQQLYPRSQQQQNYSKQQQQNFPQQQQGFPQQQQHQQNLPQQQQQSFPQQQQPNYPQQQQHYPLPQQNFSKPPQQQNYPRSQQLQQQRWQNQPRPQQQQNFPNSQQRPGFQPGLRYRQPNPLPRSSYPQHHPTDIRHRRPCASTSLQHLPQRYRQQVTVAHFQQQQQQYTQPQCPRQHLPQQQHGPVGNQLPRSLPEQQWSPSQYQPVAGTFTSARLNVVPPPVVPNRVQPGGQAANYGSQHAGKGELKLGSSAAGRGKKLLDLLQ